MRHLALWPKRNNHDLWKDFSEVFGDFNRGFGDLSLRDESAFNFTPNLDIKETQESYQVHLDVPGISKDDIKIEVRENALFVTGERKREEKHEGDFVRYERSFGRFERVVQLPKEIEADGVNASYKDGVLDITIPKSKSTKARVITVK
jgi:HSP20 family protein